MSNNFVWCRFCGSSNKQHTTISIELLHKINYCLPINISVCDESASNKICICCTDTINTFHEFVEKVVLMEKEHATRYLNAEESKFDVLKTVSDKIRKLPDLKIKKVVSKTNVESEEEKDPSRNVFKNVEGTRGENFDYDETSDPSYEPYHCDESESKIPINIKRKLSKVQVVHIQGPASYICMTCKEKFPTFETLKEHIKSNIPCKSVTLTCDKCSKVCDSKKSLYQHSLTHRDKWSFMCEECGKSYSNRFNLENHKSSFHGENVEEYGSIYKCKVCDKQFTTRKDLYQHINSHSKESQTYLCETCGKTTFTSLEALRSHIRVHLDIRNFNCDQCQKKFRSRLQLQQHIHVHTGIKPFVCESCKKSYAKKTSLIAHLRIHTGVLPYSCVICNEKFASTSKLKTHGKCHVTKIG